MRNKKFNLLELREKRKEWNSVITDFWENDKRIIYQNRKMAVDMYIDDYNVDEIFNITKIKHDKLTRLIDRCLKINLESGQEYGYTALIPQKRVITSKMTKKHTVDISTSKRRGSFNMLLLIHPKLDLFIKDNYFRKNKSILEKNISPFNLHKKFLEECKKQGIQDYEYPFNTKDKAQRTFYNYLKNLEAQYTNLSINRKSVNARQKFASTGKGEKIRTEPIEPFSVVQIDGHKIDMLYSVEVINKHGEMIRMPAMRMWLIAVIDVATRAIIGYSLTSEENYNQYDVLNAIRNSIIPKVPIEFSLPGLNYPENYGYPSLAISSTKWAVPCTIMLDNAKSHLAENVINKLCDNLFCSLNYGSVATPETRGIIERVFKTLEDNGYHRMVSTTGSNINDVKREHAEKDSVKYQITYNDISQLTEYFIALYNNSPHSSLDNETPLECMKRRIEEAGMQPCIANSELKHQIYELTNIRELKTIRGNLTKGKRPYITYMGVEYRNDILSQSMGLIGKNLIVDINPDDISTIRGYFEDGTELGILVAVGEWGRRRHSLKTRIEANRLKNHNKQTNNPFYAPLTELEDELNKRAEKERRARTKAARIRKEQDKEIEKPISSPIDNTISITERTHTNYSSTKEELAIKKKMENYSSEELEAIMNAGSIEDAYKQGLI